MESVLFCYSAGHVTNKLPFIGLLQRLPLEGKLAFARNEQMTDEV